MTDQSRRNSAETPFTRQLTEALEHYREPHWLTENSPLAAPYFLGEHLFDDENNALGRGRVLQQLLRKAVQIVSSMTEVDESYYLSRLLEVVYFDVETPQLAADKLGVARATYYRHVKTKLPQAVQLLEKGLIRLLRPALRPEEPADLPEHLLERHSLLTNCQTVLENGQAIAIVGDTGTGKTILAERCYQKWIQSHKVAFWFTFHAHLNDRLTNVLFSIAQFLQRLGTSSLWLQLVAERGQVNSEIALSLLRRDLQSLKQLPLLCFDNVEVVALNEAEDQREVVAFLTTLQGLTPLLLVGSDIPVQVSQTFAVEPLSSAELSTWLERSNIVLATTERDKLHDYARGNLRLLSLFLALHRFGDTVQASLERFAQSRSLDSLVRRIWTRLDEDTQEMLAALSVFQRAAPRDAWSAEIDLETLVGYQLVVTDAHGGLAIHPAYRTLIYRQLTPEERQAYHLAAAQIREERGEHTLAANHFIEGGVPALAVWSLERYFSAETSQGQGRAMLELLERLPQHQLDDIEGEMLVLLRSQLRQMLGQYDAIKRDIYSTSWSHPLLRARSQRLHAEINHARSRFDAAVRSYREGFAFLEPYLAGREAIFFHKGAGESTRLLGKLDVAWEEAQWARYELEQLQGEIQKDRGNYSEARHYYERALQIAELLNHTLGKGKTRNSLAMLAEREGDFETAIVHRRKMVEYAEMVGDLVWVAGGKTNLAMTLTDTGQPQRAVPLLQEALSVFMSIKHSRGHAYAALNLAEAYLLLGEVESAEKHAQTSLYIEEPGLMPGNFYILARIRRTQDRLEAAEQFFENALEAAQRSENSFIAAHVWRDLGTMHLSVGRRDQAKAAFEQAQELFWGLQLSAEAEKTTHHLKTLAEGAKHGFQ